jgi:hypothetical protein
LMRLWPSWLARDPRASGNRQRWTPRAGQRGRSPDSSEKVPNDRRRLLMVRCYLGQRACDDALWAYAVRTRCSRNRQGRRGLAVEAGQEIGIVCRLRSRWAAKLGADGRERSIASASSPATPNRSSAGRVRDGMGRWTVRDRGAGGGGRPVDILLWPSASQRCALCSSVGTSSSSCSLSCGDATLPCMVRRRSSWRGPTSLRCGVLGRRTRRRDKAQIVHAAVLPRPLPG